MEEQKNDTELLDLAKLVWTLFLKYVWTPGLALLHVVIRRWYYLILGVIVSMGVMIAWCHLFPVYKGYIMFQNNVWRSSDFVLKVRQMNLENGDYVAERMGVSPSVLAVKKEILPHFVYTPDTINHASYFVDYWDRYYAPHEERMEIMTSRFCVEVRAYNRESLKEWAQGLIRYFENDPYIADLGKQRLNNLEVRVQGLERELQALDSLRTQEYFHKKGVQLNYSGGVMVNEKPSLYHGDILALEEQYTGLKAMLEYDRDPVVVVTDMQIEHLPLNYWQRNIMDAVRYGLLLGLIVILLVEYRKPIKNFVKQ